MIVFIILTIFDYLVLLLILISLNIKFYITFSLIKISDPHFLFFKIYNIVIFNIFFKIKLKNLYELYIDLENLIYLFQKER